MRYNRNKVIIGVSADTHNSKFLTFKNKVPYKEYVLVVFTI